MKDFFQDIFSVFFKDPIIEERRQLARKLSWKFWGKQRIKPNEDQQDLDLFKGQKSKPVKGVLQYQLKGIPGVIRVYDLMQKTDFRKRPTTVFEYTQDRMNLTRFAIRPRKKFNAFKGLFTSSDHFFATTPEFDEYYEIASADQTRIKKDLNEDFLDIIGDVPGWIVEGKGHYLYLYQTGKQLNLEELEPQITSFNQLCFQLNFGKSVG